MGTTGHGLSDKSILRAVNSAIRGIVRPWEVICGLTDIGFAYVPDICAKTPQDFEKHEGEYMDADIPIINKETGEIMYKEWDDEEIQDGMRKGKYIEIQKKPEYARA